MLHTWPWGMICFNLYFVFNGETIPQFFYFDDRFVFLGTLNQDCAPSPSPAQEKAAKKNESIFDRKHHEYYRSS